MSTDRSRIINALGVGRRRKRNSTASLIRAARGAGPLQASSLVLPILHTAQRRKTLDTKGQNAPPPRVRVQVCSYDGRRYKRLFDSFVDHGRPCGCDRAMEIRLWYFIRGREYHGSNSEPFLRGGQHVPSLAELYILGYSYWVYMNHHTVAAIFKLYSETSTMISLSDVLLYKKAVAPQGAIYGLQCALFVASIPILVEGKAWILMLAVAVLFGASTVGLWANINWIRHTLYLDSDWEPLERLIHDWAHDYPDVSDDEKRHLVTAIRVASRTNYNINDGLVLHLLHAEPLASGTGSRVAAVLLLLLESGAVYCVLWVLDILSNAFYWDWHTGIETGIPESFRIVDELFYLFAGIYPTFVVVVVALQQQKDAVRRTKGQGSFLESLCLVPDNGHVAQPAGGTYRPVGDFASTGSTETDSSDEIELDYRSREDGRGEVA
ncbi:hypothetical protein EV714DRAFT_269350 [Schizophyllum commune]